MLAARATVRAGRCVFLADVYLDADVDELNPQDVALAWIKFVLPEDAWPRRIDTSTLPRDVRARSLRWRFAIEPASNVRLDDSMRLSQDVIGNAPGLI